MTSENDIKHAALSCIICGKTLPQAFVHDTDNAVPEPFGGTWFYSHGQYGSTVYDDMHGEYLLICICDEDILKIAQQGMILERKPVRREVVTRDVDTYVWNPPLRWDAEEGRAMWDDPDQQVST